MAKPIEVILPDGGSSYHVTVDEAWELVRSKNAHWTGRKQIERGQDDNIKVTWEPRQSGYAGPVVLQVVT
jgi:hypothetical protein